MAKMDDSPLSITASIAGILTFIAAICTFIYIRYSTLRDGREEITTILESVAATIEETRAIQAAQPAPVTPVRDEPEAIRLQRLMEELYSIELKIMARCKIVYTGSLKGMQAEAPPRDMTLSTWNDVLQEVQGSRERKRAQGMLGYVVAMSRVVNFERLTASSPGLWVEMLLLVVLSLGMTPTLVRWYLVRKRVLELIKRREIIRSRLLFHQISVAASAARNHESLVQGLMEQRYLLEAKFSQATDLLEATNATVRRLVDDNYEMRGLILRWADLSNQHDTTRKRASAVAEEDQHSQSGESE